MKTEKMKYFLPIPIIMCVALAAMGGLFDSTVAFIGALIAISLFVMLMKGETFLKRDSRKVFLIPLGILAVAVVVSFWAVDYMHNLMGVLRLGVVCLWMWLVRCREDKERAFAKGILPLLGCIDVVISAFSLCIPSLKGWFWENERLSGFFQYANTNALFLAVGILILVYGWKEGKKKIFSMVQLVILLIGFLMTGSRSVLLVLAGWGIWYAIKTAEFRKPFLLGTGLFLVLGGVFVAITGNTQNIGRIFTIFTSNSTLWGRALYYRDALILLSKKFYGLGRMGYYYSQGTFQSGVYHIKFVHNDFLQLALDYGVIALVLLVLFLGWQLVRGKQNRTDKCLLLFICVASVVDFHCQYLLVLMMACLFLDYGDGSREKKSQLKENYFILPVLIMVFLYIGIGTGAERMGNPNLALSMIPGYTTAQEKIILGYMGTIESYEEATRLIDKNPYNITAYIVRGSFLASQLQVEPCIADLDRMLKLDPYNVEYYKQYETLLQNMCTEGELFLEEEEKKMLQDRMESLPKELEEMETRTSSLAYKIKDKPIFSYEAQSN